ncbi:hypothetical protein G9P44_005019 [Scheffersomyces stipitis]|nr:hypothetical protein G9P44_005019 [Scheffersomyces stipitis]
MPEVAVDDPLSKRTARMSISTSDLDAESHNAQIRELLSESGIPGRRDSAVSLTSLNEDEIQKSDPNASTDAIRPPTSQKRRRSSAQSFSSTTVAQVNKLIKTESLTKGRSRKKSHMSAGSPQLSINVTGEKRLPFRSMRDLILKVFNCTSERPPKWFQFEKASGISKVVVCMVPGLPIHISESITTPQDIYDEKLSFLYETFSDFIATSSPGSKDSLYPSLETLINVPLTKKEKKQLLEDSKNTKITLYDLLMTTDQMVSHNYPVKVDVEKDEKWVETKAFDHDGSHTFALDCEFCEAKSGKVLTRISLINFQGEVVLDKYVKPDEEIIDYLTKYSGITEEKLANITTSLKDIQEELLSIISADDILIGHSLESDLNVMKFKHLKIVDTAVIYEHVRGPPSKPALKWLTSNFLDRQIQCGEVTGEGHSSVEDSNACLDLVKLKLQEGLCFGLNVGEVSIFKRLATEHKSRGEDFQSLLINYANHKEQESYAEPSDHNVQRIYVSNDDEVLSRYQEESVDKNMVVLNLRELDFTSGRYRVPDHYTGPVSCENNSLLEITLERLKLIYNSLPANALFIIHSEVGDPREMFRLQSIRKKFQKMDRDGEDLHQLAKEEIWDSDKLQQLIEETIAAKEAVTLVKVKTVDT